MSTDYSLNPAVEYAEPNKIVRIQMIPDDTYYNSSNSWGQGYDDLWGVKKIQSSAAWDTAQGDGVVVAVVDTGLDYNHEDIWDNVWVDPGVIGDINADGKINLYDCDLNSNHRIEQGEIINHMFGWDFTTCAEYDPDTGYCKTSKSEDNNPKDGNGHGSHVAGIVAAVGNNNKGVIGVAPKSKIRAIKGLNDYGEGSVVDLANSLYYAVKKGQML